MQRFDAKRMGSLTAFLLLGSFMLAAPNLHAQQLWKYTDKDGKVTYSDKAPKKGEKAEPVVTDPSTNIINAPKNTVGGVPQKLDDVKARAAEREKLRDQLRKDVETAREQLAEATKALEDGREPTEEERQIVVGRDKKGKPTGVNSIIRKPEYYERIASLEEAVKTAEAKVAKAEETLKKNAP